MTIRELYQAVIAGTIPIDANGHEIRSDYVETFVKDRFERDVECSLGGNDGKWSEHKGKTVEQVNAGMRDFYLRKLDSNLCEDGIVKFSDFPDVRCFGCGQQLNWRLADGKLILDRKFNSNPNFPNRRPADCPDFIPVENCPVNGLTSFSGEIKVSSPLVFTNFFRDFPDSTEEDEYTEEWSLNHLIGRKNITEFKSKNHNIAYGQMGNMSVGIYVAADKKSIIVGDAYPDNEDTIFPGYKLIGDVSLGVWRWEATDLNTLPSNWQETAKETDPHMDVVIADVAHGIWQFEHFYDFIKRGEDSPLYSKFVLKETV